MEDSTKKKATFLLSEETHKKLKLQAAIEGKKMTEIVEESLELYFNQNSQNS